MLSKTHIIRAAGLLQRAWLRRSLHINRKDCQDIEYLAERQRALHQAWHSLDKALGHGLSLIVPQLRMDLLDALRAVQRAADHASQSLRQPDAFVPDLPFWVAELQQLQDEFGDLQILWKNKVISVTTEPVALQEVYLGAFAIQLHTTRLSHLSSGECFDIIALDPNPASTDQSVTHPHVKQMRLCAGEASTPLCRALEQGRLADAFCLIRGVLTTYNSGSPHVPLENWYGGSQCHDCGRLLNEDDLHYCEACSNDYCNECTATCTNCGTARCTGCLTRCAVCDEWCCSRCIKSSTCSGRLCCPACMDVCERCHKPIAIDEMDEERALCETCDQLRPQLEASSSPTATLSSQSTEFNDPEDHHVPFPEPVCATCE